MYDFLKNEVNILLANRRYTLIEARENKGFSRKELASLSGVTLEHIKSLEYGRVNPSTSLLFKLCKVLDSTPDEIFNDITNE